MNKPLLLLLRTLLWAGQGGGYERIDLIGPYLNSL